MKEMTNYDLNVCAKKEGGDSALFRPMLGLLRNCADGRCSRFAELEVIVDEYEDADEEPYAKYRPQYPEP